MSPQEKAIEIFNSMKGFRVKHSHAKKCAKYAVQMILNSVEVNTPTYEFWGKVYHELNQIKTP